MVEELAVAGAAGSHASTLARIARVDVLVLDDLLVTPMNEAERRDLLDVIEDRYDRCSTVITSQLPTKSWHEALGDRTIADAICDRLVQRPRAVASRSLHAEKERPRPRSTPDHHLTDPTRRSAPIERPSVPERVPEFRRNQRPS